MANNPKDRVCTHQQVEATLRAHDTFFINDCFCRGPARAGKTAWDYCGHSIDTCMGVNRPDPNEFDVPYREITQAEALAKFHDWRNQGHFFRTMEDEGWICFCCACGCEWFRDKDGNLVEDPCEKSAFLEHTDHDTCVLCGSCVEVCAYHARELTDDALIIDQARCYGCSSCEYACPEDAVTMLAR